VRLDTIAPSTYQRLRPPVRVESPHHLRADPRATAK
jgi:hypothetical protein